MGFGVRVSLLHFAAACVVLGLWGRGGGEAEGNAEAEEIIGAAAGWKVTRDA